MEKQRKKATKTGQSLELEIRESAIRVGGHARLHPSNLKAAGLKSGGPMRVKGNGREILVTVVGDSNVAAHEVVIRTPDLQRLKMDAGAQVNVTPHELIADTVKRQSREASKAVQKAARDSGKAAVRARRRVKSARIKATQRITAAAKRPPKEQSKRTSKAARKRTPKRGRKAKST